MAIPSDQVKGSAPFRLARHVVEISPLHEKQVRETPETLEHEARKAIAAVLVADKAFCIERLPPRDPGDPFDSVRFVFTIGIADQEAASARVDELAAARRTALEEAATTLRGFAAMLRAKPAYIDVPTALDRAADHVLRLGATPIGDAA